MSFLFFIFLFLLMLNGVIAVGFSPSSLVFELEPNQEECETIILTSDSETISVSDSWAENKDVEWKISLFEKNTNYHGISINYDNELSIDEREVEVCLSGGAVFSAQSFSWTPDYTQAGEYEVGFNVTDGEDWDSETITITVDNINRAPVLQDIGNQTTLEDTLGSVLANATDLDNQALTYTITDENVLEVDCSAEGNNITFTPASNWYGDASCKVDVSDGSGTDSKTFYIEVQPVNDAPVLSKISNIVVNEGDLIEIISNAEDVDSSSLVYSINDTRFTDNGEGNFTWQTDLTDEGVYSVAISVNDGTLTNSQIAKVTVSHTNEPPQIDPLANITIDEDSGFVNDITLSATDNDGEIERYVVSNENTNEVDCSISDSKLGVEPAKDFFGTASCVIKVYDNDGASDETTVYIIVNNINDAPEITSFSPGFNPIIADGKTYDFSIVWEDTDNTEAEIAVKWYKDSVEAGLGNSYVFSDSAVGSFNITVVVSDGLASDSKEWNLITSDIPIANNFDGNTTNFTGMNDTDLSSVYLILEKVGIGKIEFLDPVDLRDVADLDNYASIINLILGIDTIQLSSLKNMLARITFYDLDFEETPTIYYDSGFTVNPESITQVCPDSICSNITYENNDLTFYVSSFSSFKIGDAKICSQQGGDICKENEICLGESLDALDSDSCCSTACVFTFIDAEVCEIKDNNIKITIRDPDDNDNFEIEEIITAEIKIENKFDEKLDFDVEVYLYDLDEDESIEDDKENINLDDGESDTIEFEIEIPKDVEGSNFAVYVFVEDDEDRCNSDYVEIEIEREEHKVIIEDMEIFPQTVSSGKYVEVMLKIKNTGSSDEDVYIEITNSALNILEIGNEFEIEEYDKDDVKIKTLDIKIPKEAQDGRYTLQAKVIFDDGEDSASETFSVLTEKFFKQIETSQEAISIKIPSEKVKKEKILEQDSFIFFLTIGILILSLIILIVVKSRKN